MKILRSHYLSDGKGFNHGQPVDLIRIEREEDYDALLNHILRTGYYNSSYFRNHIAYPEGRVKFEAFILSCLIHFLRPAAVLEVGCGRGDVLALLAADRRLKVRGIDFSPDIFSQAWPNLKGKLDCGDVLEVCRQLHARNIRFDTFCAFDFWEHLLPSKLDEYIKALIALAEKDALFFFTVPAFGVDRVFGEIFPLEFEENREQYDLRQPFRYLIAETTDPPIPAQGHLLWAHSEWWEQQFEKHGLIRQVRLESRMHRLFDEHLFYASRSFYLFALNLSPGRRRSARLARQEVSFLRKWKHLVRQWEKVRRLETVQGQSFMDPKEMYSTIHHAEVQAVLEMKGRIEKKIWGSAESKARPDPLGRFKRFIEHWAYRLWDDYLEGYKRRHYGAEVD